MNACDLTEKLAKGDGSTKQFPFPFKYQNESDINVALYDNSTKQWVDQTSDKWSLDTARTVLFDTAPPSSDTANVKIYRDTDITDLEAEFFPGSAIKAEDLNNNFEQLQYAIQEVDCNSSSNDGVIEDLQGEIDQNKDDIADLEGRVTQNESDIATNAANIATNTENIATNADDIAQNTSDIADNTAALAQRWNKTDETIDESETWVSDDSTVATTGAIEKRILNILDDPSVPTGGYWNKDDDTINSSKNWSPSDNTVGTTKAIDNQLTPIKNDVSTNASNIATNAANIATNANDIANRWNKTTETLRGGWTSSDDLVATTQAIRDTFAAVSTSVVPPNNPEDGDLWLNSTNGVLYFYYVDDNSSQWISVSTGPEGPAGEDGANATVDVGYTNTGQPGSFASVNNSGTTQNAVFNFTIPRGEDGTDGTDGVDGVSATIQVGTTSTNAAGTGATVVNVGTQQNAVFDFGIPKGEDGADGLDGEAATVNAGTTTTSNPGTNAQVTNVGTVNDAIFDFLIPRGDQGIQGIQGEPGLTKTGQVPPNNPVEGELWFNTNNGVTYIYYDDGNSSQWVSVSSGPEGPQGPQGEEGSDGSDGDDGKDATIAVGGTTTLSPGSNAYVNNSGSNTEAIFYFGIPEGQPGTDGVNPTVSVGTTTTLAPGSSATVVNTGTSTAAQFSFGIPKGDDGRPANAQPGQVPPNAPYVGDLWFNSQTGVTYVWYDDGNSSQWVSTSNSYSPAVAGYGSTKPTQPATGQLFYDTDDSELQLWNGSSWISI